MAEARREAAEAAEAEAEAVAARAAEEAKAAEARAAEEAAAATRAAAERAVASEAELAAALAAKRDAAARLRRPVGGGHADDTSATRPRHVLPQAGRHRAEAECATLLAALRHAEEGGAGSKGGESGRGGKGGGVVDEAEAVKRVSSHL